MAIRNVSAKNVQFLVEGAKYFSRVKEAVGFNQQLVYSVEVPNKACCVFIFAKRKDEYGVFVYSTNQEYIKDDEAFGLTKDYANQVHRDFLKALNSTMKVSSFELRKEETA